MIVELNTYIAEVLAAYALPASITDIAKHPTLVICKNETQFFDHETAGIVLWGYTGKSTPLEHFDGNRTITLETEIVIKCKIISTAPNAYTIASIMEEEMLIMIHSGSLRKYHLKINEIPKAAVDKSRASVGVISTLEHTITIP